jgi:beta-mannanase
MNGNWYPWAAGVNGNTAAQYVAAWQHVHSIFVQHGATNVTWVWCPNVSYSGSTPISQLYPGDTYVDQVGLDGYNGGTALNWGGWLSFQQIFGASLSTMGALTTKPVVIGETASAEQGGSKAAWITDMFTQLRNNPQIVAFTWFNYNKETDWRIQSSKSATAAYAAGVSDPRYG